MPEPLLRPLTVGSVTLPNNLVLSPMAGFSDLPFRVLARRHGAGLVCSEMVAATSVMREIPNTLVRMRTLEEEAPMSIQVFGTDPDAVAEAARDVERRCAVLGFNMGCPAYQIKRQGCGAALLDHPELAEDLVRAIKGASTKPLIVKMRAGNGKAMDAVAFARRMEAAGADALIFHARTAAQGYSGLADWSLIRRVKEGVGIPVIGNGDVTDGASAERALRESGADGIAVGRASLGDPRVFGRIAHHLATGTKAPMPTPEERLEDFREYLRVMVASGLGELRALDEPGYDPEARGHLAAAHVKQQAQQFTRGMRGGGLLRNALDGCRTAPEFLAAFEAHVAGLAEWRARRAADSAASS